MDCHASVGAVQLTKAGVQIDTFWQTPRTGSEVLEESCNSSRVSSLHSRGKMDLWRYEGRAQLNGLGEELSSTFSILLRRSDSSTTPSLYFVKGTSLGSQPRNKAQHDPVLAVFTVLSYGPKRKIYPGVDEYFPQLFTEERFGRALASSQMPRRQLGAFCTALKIIRRDIHRRLDLVSRQADDDLRDSFPCCS